MKLKQNEFTVYQISLKGYIETEKPKELLEAFKKAAEENGAELYGNFVTYMLAPYVDYQKADVTDSQDRDSTLQTDSVDSSQ